MNHSLKQAGLVSVFLLFLCATAGAATAPVPGCPLEFDSTLFCLCCGSLESEGYEIDDKGAEAILFGATVPVGIRKYEATGDLVGEGEASQFVPTFMHAIVVRSGDLSKEDAAIFNQEHLGDAYNKYAKVEEKLKSETVAAYMRAKGLSLKSVDAAGVRFSPDAPRAVRLSSVLVEAATGTEWYVERFHFFVEGWVVEMYAAQAGKPPVRGFPASVRFLMEEEKPKEAAGI